MTLRSQRASSRSRGPPGPFSGTDDPDEDPGSFPPGCRNDADRIRPINRLVHLSDKISARYLSQGTEGICTPRIRYAEARLPCRRI